MKTKNILFLILIIFVLSLVGCEPTRESTERYETNYPVIGKIIQNNHNGSDSVYVDIRVFVIDSCEYIGRVYGGSVGILTHKGNCKFCEERKKRNEK